MTISSIGVGSGLPLNELLQDLRLTQEQALTGIRSQRQRQEAKVSSLAQVKSAAEKLNGFSERFFADGIFDKMSAKVSAQAISVKADSSARATSVDVEVQQLAQSQTLTASGVADHKALIGDPSSSATLSFEIDGQTHTISLDVEDQSLDGIVRAINAKSDLGLQAAIINDGSSDPYRLSITTEQTGTKAAVEDITVQGNEALSGLLSFDTLDRRDAKDAQITLNGVPITSQSNTIEGALEGVTISLREVSEAPIKVTVESDQQGAKKAIEDFVSAYNDLRTLIKRETAYDMENQKASALMGDSTVRSLQTTLSRLTQVVVGSDAVRTLTDIGVTTDHKTGELVIDDQKLTASLRDHGASVQALFQSDGGVAKRLEQLTQPFISESGSLDTASKGAQASADRLQLQYDRAMERIDSRMEQYRAQFSAMDAMLAQMNSLSGYLSQQFAALNSLQR